jgi:DinB superfamily
MLGGQLEARMIPSINWTVRTFTFDMPLGAFPAVLERLRGTPARAAELAASFPESALSQRSNGKWSAKENLAHLTDLHPLDAARLKDFLAGAKMLTAADMTNPATEAADHNRVPIALLLERMRAARQGWILQLEELGEEEVARVAVHPRLKQPMRLLDWAYFIAEHDDHHLARARQAGRAASR